MSAISRQFSSTFFRERLTQQIAEAVHSATKGRCVGVVMERVHMCVNMRGCKKTVPPLTSCMLGEFRSCSMTLDEFLRLVGK